MKEVKKYRERPETLEGCQWFKDGDHDEVLPINAKDYTTEELEEPCHLCKKKTKKHGVIENPMGAEVVCPGDYVMKTGEGFYFASKPVYFEGLYEEI